jgi:hypothetical protein
MGRIKPKTVSDLMDVANRFADGEDACTINARDHQKMTEEPDMEVKGEGPIITIIMDPTTK